jgi:predicted HTH transcriptional regulator
MYHEMAEAGLPLPEWIEEPAAVRLILRNGIEQRRLATPDEVQARTRAELSERQRQAMEYVRERGSISNRDYRQAFGVSNKTAYQDLKALVVSHISF